MKRTLTYPIHLILLAAMGLLLVSTAAAQRRGADHEPGRRGDHVRFLRGLDLTDAQKVQIRESMQEVRTERQSWHESHPNPTPEDRRAFFTAQREKLHQALQDILTPDQLARLENRRERRGREGRRGAGRSWEALDLSDDQRDAVRALRREHHATLRQWMADHPDATREERRAYMREQREAMRGALEEILTLEQLDQFEAMRSERGRLRRDRRSGADSQATPDASELRQDAEAERFSLGNYPNPFNPSTEINFNLTERAHVSLVVYDAQGREVRRLVDQSLSSGARSATFDASGLPSGVYLYRLTVGGETATGRMTFAQ